MQTQLQSNGIFIREINLKVQNTFNIREAEIKVGGGQSSMDQTYSSAKVNPEIVVKGRAGS